MLKLTCLWWQKVLGHVVSDTGVAERIVGERQGPTTLVQVVGDGDAHVRPTVEGARS